MARKILVEIVGDSSSLEKAFGKAETSGSKFGSSIGKVGKVAAFTAGGAALGGLALVLKQSIDSANEHAKVYAQTNAVLKSTGHSAGVSAKQIAAFADHTEKLTGIDDVVVQKGENMLLTFTNIRNGIGKNNKIFTQASKVLTDMTVALGSDPQKQAIQLGKALNDPVKGVSALARVGVTFTDGQKKTIAALVKGGHTAAAQKVILKELNKEFGGSAKAFGRTLPGQIQIFKAHLDDVAQSIGMKLIPYLAKGLKVLSDLLAIFTGSGSATSKFQAALERLGVSAQTSRRIINDLKETFNDLKRVVVTSFQIMRPILAAFWSEIKSIVQLVDDLIHGRWSKLWGDSVQVIRKVVGLWKTVLMTAVKTLGGIAERIGAAILHGIQRGLSGLASWIIGQIVKPINAIIDALNKVPGVHIAHVGGGGGGGSTAGIAGRRAGGLPPAVTGLSPTPHPVTGPPTGGRGNAAAAVHLNGPVTVVANNPQQLVSALQRVAGRGSSSRSGPYAGMRLGLI